MMFKESEKTVSSMLHTVDIVHFKISLTCDITGKKLILAKNSISTLMRNPLLLSRSVRFKNIETG